MLLRDMWAKQVWVSTVLNKGHLLSDRQNLLYIKNCYILEGNGGSNRL